MDLKDTLRTITDRVIKLTPTELSEALSGADIIDFDVTEQFLHTFS